MKKLRNSTAFKCFAIILFAVSLLLCAASGLAAIYLYSEHAITKRGREALKQNIITDIAYREYNSRAVNYYENYLYGIDDDKDRNFFSEDNTNYSFRARVVGSEEDYPELLSYTPSSYQYSQTDNYSITGNQYNRSKILNTPKNEILATTAYICCSDEDLSALGWFDSDYNQTDDELYRTEYGYNYVSTDALKELRDKYIQKNGYDYFEHKYYNNSEILTDEITDYEDVHLDNYCEYMYDRDYTVYMVTDGINYYFIDNVPKVDEYINNLYFENENTEIDYDLWYDNDTEQLYINTYISPILNVELDWYIKSDLKAYDGFYNSLKLRYIDDMAKYAVPVCVVSGIVFLICFALLIAAAGHKRVKEEDEDGNVCVKDVVKLGMLDKIPYDIILLLLLISLGFGVVNFGNAYYGSIESVIAIACAVICSILGAHVVMTTAARLKCENGKFLKKTVVYKLCVWLFDGIKYVWKNINLFGKYLGIIFIVTVIEILVAANEGAGMTFTLIIIEKLIVTGFVVYSIININKIKKYTKSLAEGNTDDEFSTENMHGEFLSYAEDLGHVNDGIKAAVENQMKSEMMKTELITNVSHDIKTPLTSIINYVDLLEKENIDNEKAQEYLEVLNRQSQRLKKLIIDLIDVSKASTGNVDVNLEKLDLSIILTQLNGEYEEQFEAKKLKLVINNKASDTHIMADGRQIYRVFDNLFVNIKKYAQDNTRVYIDITDEGDKLGVSMKNISKEELNISGEELMERFTRGDRSRNTEGSGLGLSIAKSLIELQNGQINIAVDGDLYKVELLIPKA